MDVKPDVSFQERASINNGLRTLNREKRWDCGSTQMTRVIIAARHGLVKQVRKVRNPGSGKTVWFYRLVPASRDGGV